MKFIKMEGLGNDYVYVDLFTEPLPDGDLAYLARRVSDRHFGVGSDGLVLVMPSQQADCRMRMFNSDGSESEMCGNAVRCITKLMYDAGRHRDGAVTIETLDGVKTGTVIEHRGNAALVEVSMGKPRFAAHDIPTLLGSGEAVGVLLPIDGTPYTVTCVSMGNPHCVIVTDEITDGLVAGLGPRIERHEAFPARTNVEFARVVDPHTIEMRVWERGAGETLACGTGACATLAACVRLGLCERAVSMRLRGGTMDLRWDEGGSVIVRAPAVTVFTGEICI